MKDPCFRYFSQTALATAGLLLSHMVTAAFFLPLAGLYLIYLGLMQKEAKLRKFGVAFLGLVAGFALAAFSILPAVFENKYLNKERFLTGLYDYHMNFLHPVQFFLSPQKYTSYKAVILTNAFPFQFGWIYILGFCAGIACVWFWASKETKKAYIFFLLALLATVWMMTVYSKMIWERVSVLRLMQFPWRLLEPASFFLCSFIAGIGLIPSGRYRRILCMLTVALIIITRMPDFKPPGWHFMPITNFPHVVRFIQPMARDFQPISVRRELSTFPEHLMDFFQGTARIIAHQQKSPVAHSFQIFAQTPATACFYNFYFPGWGLSIDNQKTGFLENNYGLMLFDVPPGRHQIDIQFTPTPVRIIGAGISLFCLMGMILTAVKKRNKNGKKS